MNVHIPEETYFWTLINLGQQRTTKDNKEKQRKQRGRKQRGQIYLIDSLLLCCTHHYKEVGNYMPRMGRVVLPNYPHHVVQRGHNRQVVFAEPSDYQRYLDDMRELKTLFDVKVYAFCLMTNHVHLLLAPGDSVAGLGQLMKGLAGRTTRYRNKLEGRSGTLWESRYKSSVVQTDTYLLACSRYIELNPVRAQMVQHAQDYPWSSLHLRLNETTEE
jgi:putative transposase